MVELAAIALRFRSDCLRLAVRIDIDRELRDRFREDAAYWAGMAEGIMFAAKANARSELLAPYNQASTPAAC
jgi:hypothetical protein